MTATQTTARSIVCEMPFTPGTSRNWEAYKSNKSSTMKVVLIALGILAGVALIGGAIAFGLLFNSSHVFNLNTISTLGAAGAGLVATVALGIFSINKYKKNKQEKKYYQYSGTLAPKPTLTPTHASTHASTPTLPQSDATPHETFSDSGFVYNRNGFKYTKGNWGMGY